VSTRAHFYYGISSHTAESVREHISGTEFQVTRLSEYESTFLVQNLKLSEYESTFLLRNFKSHG